MGIKKTAFIMALGLIVLLSGPAFAGKEYEMALLHYAKGDYKNAVSVLEEYTAINPDPEAYYLMGYALYNLQRFEDAGKSFEAAYLVDPKFSPREVLKDIGERKALSGIKPAVKRTKTKKPKAEAVTPSAQAAPKPEAAKAVAPPVKAEAKAVEKKPEAVAAPAVNAPVANVVVKPAVVRPAPVPPPAEAFPIPPLFILIAGVALYVFFSLCLFIIARKLDVSASWLAFVPIAQLLVMVKAAEKPVWWILLLLVPLVNVVIGVYLWMLIADNLGKSKIFGILMLLPVINFVILALLAFTGKKIVAPPAEDFSGGYGEPDLPEPPGFETDEKTETGEDFGSGTSSEPSDFDFPEETPGKEENQ